MFESFAAAEHHGGGSAQAELVRGAVHQEPLLGGALQARNPPAYLVVQDFRSSAGDRVEPRVHEAHYGVAYIQAGDFRDVQDFRGREAMQMERRVAPFDARKQVLVIINLEVGMKAALHEDSRSAQGQRFVDLLKNRLERLDVSF